MFGDIISQRYDFYVIYKVRIGQNSCQMTQKHTFFEKRVEKFWKFRNSYYFCAPKQTGCSSARLEYTSGGRVVAGSNPVIPTDLQNLDNQQIIKVFFFAHTTTNAARVCLAAFTFICYILLLQRILTSIFCPSQSIRNSRFNLSYFQVFTPFTFFTAGTPLIIKV